MKLFSSYSMNSTNSLIRPPLNPPPLPGRTHGGGGGGARSSLGGAHRSSLGGAGVAGTADRKKRESKRLSGHCAVERTVTQVTYCSDNPDNRDSGLVESN